MRCTAAANVGSTFHRRTQRPHGLGSSTKPRSVAAEYHIMHAGIAASVVMNPTTLTTVGTVAEKGALARPA